MSADLLEAFAAHLSGDAPLPAITTDDAADLALAMHAQVDRGTSARVTKAAELGRTIACSAGCANCCRTVLVGAEGESQAIARFLRTSPGALAHFRASYPGWSAAAADLIAAATAAALSSDAPALKSAMSAAADRDLMCPFNRAGSCTIYDVRPNVCRIAHALDTSTNCVPDRTVDFLDFLPISQFMSRIRPLELAISAAVPGAPARAVVAVRVAALL
jgi:hypothetical protein